MQVSEIRVESGVEVVHRVFDCLNRRDLRAAEPYWAEDIEEEFPSAVLQGTDEVFEWFTAILDAFPDFHIEATHTATEGELVFVAWRATGTFTGKRWLGIEPTGTAVVLEGVDRFTIRDGKVVHNRVLYDQLSFARQIGMLPPDASVADRAMRAGFNARTRALRLVSRER